MRSGKTGKWLTWSVVALGVALLSPGRAAAHCDALDGPVVKAAQQALDTRNPALALMWVQASDEPDVRKAFEQALAVRALSPQAKALADRFFFETLVRVHRAGEGAPFTGLKPAGGDIGPAIPAADKALENGSVEPVVKLLTGAMEDGLRHHFTQAIRARTSKPGDVAAGRAYVKAYVEFIHYAERIFEASATGVHGHFDDATHRR